jgi:hypothetical protein
MDEHEPAVHQARTQFDVAENAHRGSQNKPEGLFEKTQPIDDEEHARNIAEQDLRRGHKQVSRRLHVIQPEAALCILRLSFAMEDFDV